MKNFECSEINFIVIPPNKFFSFASKILLIRTFEHLSETLYWENSVPWDVKTLGLYGLILTILDYNFIWFNFYSDFLAQITNKNQPHHQWQVRFSQDLKLCTQGYIWKRLCLFLNQLHFMVNWLVSLHHKLFQMGKIEYST